MQSISSISNQNINQKPSYLKAAQSNQSFFKPFIQPQLTINQPNDIYEQEADAIADRAMRMPNNESIQQSFFKPAISAVQRKCEHCEEEKKKMQRKEINNDATVTNTSTENYISSLNGKGRSLTEGERKFFEPRIGYDFSNVQLHTNEEANQSAKSINALAYTYGNNIVFGSGQYQPNTEEGKKLMAHELTHVVQQQSNLLNRKIIQRKVCVSPSEWLSYMGFLGTYDSIANKIGLAAEKIIEKDYCDKMDCSDANEYFDNKDPLVYVSFLSVKNPNASSAILPLNASKLKRPDILVHKPGIQEMYEIKPASESGKIAGVKKLTELLVWMKQYNLPYFYGISYTPTEKMWSHSITLAKNSIEVTLKVNRPVPGLIVYEFCIAADLRGILLMAAVLIALKHFAKGIGPLLNYFLGKLEDVIPLIEGLIAYYGSVAANIPLAALDQLLAFKTFLEWQGIAIGSEAFYSMLEKSEEGIDLGTFGTALAATGLAACFLSGACEVGGLIAGGAALAAE